jgi:hypothetical protein
MIRRQPKFRHMSFCIAIVATAGSPTLSAEASHWPAIQPLHESHTFLDPGRGDADTPFVALVKSLDGALAYRLECHNGNYDGESISTYSGDFQCALYALKGNALITGNLLAANTSDERSTDWWNRGRMRSSQLLGECLAYPEYSTDRNFKLRNMRVTLRFTDIAWGTQSDERSAPRLARFTFDISVVPDKAAKGSRAALAVGPPPPRSCYP